MCFLVMRRFSIWKHYLPHMFRFAIEDKTMVKRLYLSMLSDYDTACDVDVEDGFSRVGPRVRLSRDWLLKFGPTSFEEIFDLLQQHLRDYLEFSETHELSAIRTWPMLLSANLS